MSTMKDFSSLNSLIKDTAVSANLRAIQDACSLADQALSTAQQIASEYARLYTQVQWLTYDSNGDIQDETPVEQQKVANSVIAAARQRLKTILERLNALPSVETTSTQQITLKSDFAFPLVMLSTEVVTNPSQAGQAVTGSVISKLIVFEGNVCLLLIPCMIYTHTSQTAYVGALNTANKCVIYDFNNHRRKTCTATNADGQGGVVITVAAPTGNWTNNVDIYSSMRVATTSGVTGNMGKALTDNIALSGITGSVKWNVMTAVKAALPSVQSIIDALPSI